MSSQQLNRLNTEKEKLLRERDRTKDITKVSEACEVPLKHSIYYFLKYFAHSFFLRLSSTTPSQRWTLLLLTGTVGTNG